MKNLMAKRNNLLKELGTTENIMRGTLKKRYIECGRDYCHCHKDGGHGPYYYLSMSKHTGKVICEKIPEEQVQDVRNSVKNYNKLWDKILKITDINIKIIQLQKKIKRKNRGGN